MMHGEPAENAFDAHAVERCRAGQPDAFATIVERHQQAVFGTALRLLGDRDAALEVANTTFHKAYRALGGLDATRPLRPWLVRIASREALNYRRAAGTAARHTVSDPATLDALPAREPDPAHAAIDREERAAVRRAVAALPERFQLVVVLRYLHDLSYSQIARQTGLPKNTVGVYLLRARARLRALLAAEGVEADALS